MQFYLVFYVKLNWSTFWGSLSSVYFSRHIRASSVWLWTLTRTCPSTQSPSWTCTGARNAMKCPLTFTPYQKPRIAACYKVLSAYLWPLTHNVSLTPQPIHLACQLKLAWTAELSLWSLFVEPVHEQASPWMGVVFSWLVSVINCLKSSQDFFHGIYKVWHSLKDCGIEHNYSLQRWS